MSILSRNSRSTTPASEVGWYRSTTPASEVGWYSSRTPTPSLGQFREAKFFIKQSSNFHTLINCRRKKSPKYVSAPFSSHLLFTVQKTQYFLPNMSEPLLLSYIGNCNFFIWIPEIFFVHTVLLYIRHSIFLTNMSESLLLSSIGNCNFFWVAEIFVVHTVYCTVYIIANMSEPLLLSSIENCNFLISEIFFVHVCHIVCMYEEFLFPPAVTPSLVLSCASDWVSSSPPPAAGQSTTVT
jgi:hypothetical protein